VSLHDSGEQRDSEQQQRPAEKPRVERRWPRFRRVDEPSGDPRPDRQEDEDVGRVHLDARLKRELVRERERQKQVDRDRCVNENRAVRSDQAADSDGDRGNERERDRPGSPRRQRQAQTNVGGGKRCDRTERDRALKSVLEHERSSVAIGRKRALAVDDEPEDFGFCHSQPSERTDQVATFARAVHDHDDLGSRMGC